MKTRYFVYNGNNRVVVEDHDSGYAEVDRPSHIQRLREMVQRLNEDREIRNLCQDIMGRTEC